MASPSLAAADWRQFPTADSVDRAAGGLPRGHAFWCDFAPPSRPAPLESWIRSWVRLWTQAGARRKRWSTGPHNGYRGHTLAGSLWSVRSEHFSENLRFDYLSELTVSFLRPRARRRDKTARPSAVFMRVRKPCVFARRRRLGWNVLFGILL